MEIEVLTLSGERTALQVTPTDTVEELKHRIAQKAQIGIDQVKLIFDGANMTEDMKTVASYGVKDGSRVHMVVQDKVAINIDVNLPNGTTKRISVEPSEQIAMLKEKLREKFGYNVDNMELFYERKKIQGGRLSHFGIVDGTKLQVRLKNPNITVTITPEGRNIQVDVSQMETVNQLKERLYTETRIPSCQQYLIVNGKPFDSGRPADLSCGTVVQMTLKTRSG